MLQNCDDNRTIILAVFRPADPVREILRDYASGKSCGVSCFDHPLDAMARMPLMDDSRTVFIITRPETLTAEAVNAFASLVSPDTIHYVLWLDRSHDLGLRQWPLRPANLHSAADVPQLDTILNGIRPASSKIPSLDGTAKPAARQTMKIQPIPLTEAEMDALLGAPL